MSTIIQGTQLRDISLGRYTQGKTSDITTDADGVQQLFTVAGGQVLITGLWGVVTTSITTDGETLNIQMDPTTGDTKVVVEATNLGTTDTLAGDILGFRGSIDDPATNGATFEWSFVHYGQPLSFVATIGEIECDVVTASSNGVVDWYCTWVPLTPGATVVASA